MHRLDRGDDRNMWTDELHQRRDFARVIHADLEHAELDIARKPRQRKRNTPMIVERSARRMRLAAWAKRQMKRFLGAGFSNRAGDGNNLRACARTRGGSGIVHRLQCFFHNKESGVRKPCCRRFVNDRKRSALFERRFHIIVAVEAVALDRNESFARRDRARVDGNACDVLLYRALQSAARGRRQFLRGP